MNKETIATGVMVIIGVGAVGLVVSTGLLIRNILLHHKILEKRLVEAEAA